VTFQYKNTIRSDQVTVIVMSVTSDIYYFFVLETLKILSTNYYNFQLNYSIYFCQTYLSNCDTYRILEVISLSSCSPMSVTILFSHLSLHITRAPFSALAITFCPYALQLFLKLKETKAKHTNTHKNKRIL
jgi:hypothetical protein